MKRKSVSINLEGEQMARNIAMLVQRASKYESSIYIQSGDKRVNAKSIMGMMTLALAAGESVVVYAEGSDELAAIENIEKYLSSNN